MNVNKIGWTRFWSWIVVRFRLPLVCSHSRVWYVHLAACTTPSCSVRPELQCLLSPPHKPLQCLCSHPVASSWHLRESTDCWSDWLESHLWVAHVIEVLISQTLLSTPHTLGFVHLIFFFKVMLGSLPLNRGVLLFGSNFPHWSKLWWDTRICRTKDCVSVSLFL